MTGAPGGFVPPAYPHDRLIPLREAASATAGGIVDLSVGTPTDPPPPAVLAALADADRYGALRGYPPSMGTASLRAAAAAWMQRTFGVDVAADAVVACVGTKEMVASLPRYLSLRRPGRDTVLYPAVSYPTYEMGAILAGLRAVAVPTDEAGRVQLGAVAPADAERALLLWVNSPGNPAGGLDDLPAAASWGAAHGAVVASDECYAAFTWTGPPRTVLGHGTGSHGMGGVLAVHSLSKRSNLAGLRVGWVAGDPELVIYLSEVRKHAGMMVPGPGQQAAVAALGDEAHVGDQRTRYRQRLEAMASILTAVGVEVALPDGGFYLWAPAPGGDAWGWATELATRGGMLVAPGDFYGTAGSGHVRLAMVAPLDRLELVASRLGGSRAGG
ncbi:MAG: aminotransferase class I/II-fold pyridoxal phosphate-dependent enzyme [Actinomycetota bacterium]|nr:aminotransferase class I/II-fold pyridoxal phosphate-dependent enzyme [Actinomycetota bacterium]